MFYKITTATAIAGALLLADAALPVVAQTASSVPNKIICVGAAVNVREQALDSAVSTHSTAVNAAYAARATALQQAYGNGTAAPVRSGVQAAWSTFRSAFRNATSAWRTSRNAAWTQFRSAVKACRAPANVIDTGNASAEAAGQ